MNNPISIENNPEKITNELNFTQVEEIEMTAEAYRNCCRISLTE